MFLKSHHLDSFSLPSTFATDMIDTGYALPRQLDIRPSLYNENPSFVVRHA